MNRKSRTVVGILTATVLTGAGVATMASAFASAQPAAPVSVETAAPTAPSTERPEDQQRTEQLVRSVDDLVAQIGALEQAVTAGAATPTPSPSRQPGRDASTGGRTAEPAPTTTPPQVGTAPSEDHAESSESSEQEEPSDD